MSGQRNPWMGMGGADYSAAGRRRRWGRRSWKVVEWEPAREGRASVAERDARAEVWCGCGRLVVIGEWDGVVWCEGCGQCYRLSCSVKMEVFNE